MRHQRDRAENPDPDGDLAHLAQLRQPPPAMAGGPKGLTTVLPLDEIEVPVFSGQGMPGGLPAAPTTPVPPQAGGEWITCPECGERAAIDPAQRRAEDFCRRCDFPLFWSSSAVVPLSGEETGASLRRLPGTVGRAATAFVPCPHCGEPNSPTAIICIRCALSMHPEPIPEPEPVPEPVYVPPPPPEPEPEKDFPLWWVVVVGICLAIIAILVVWAALG